MTKKERLEAIMAHYAGGKTSLMADKLGVADSTISSWLARNTYDLELIFAKCENISAEWLITGKGKMIVSKVDVESKEYLLQLVESKQETIDSLKETIESLKETVKVLKGDIVVQHRSVETA